MSKSPTSLSLDALRKDGYDPWVVEIWNRFATRPGGGKGVRVDLYNFADIIAMRDDEGEEEILLVQTTSYSCVSARRRKILAEPRALKWLRAGGTIEIHGWHKKAPPGKTRKLWTCRTVTITEEDFN